MTIRKIYIDASIEADPMVHHICSNWNVPIETVIDSNVVYKNILSATDSIQKGKETLFLTQNKGSFIRECPGTRYYICCGYYILYHASFCSMDCSYCILQTYFHPPVLQYFVNHRQMFTELNQMLHEKRIRRIGTGEFTDSLIWEHLIPSDRFHINSALIDMFSKQSYAVLELKTKTTAVDRLLSLTHHRKTILSWSLNTPEMIRSEERLTSSLIARLKAASRCEAAGYPVAFHFDPLILYEGCEQAYEQVVEQIFSYISPENIVWISLGSFRFLAELKSIIRNRFPKSKIAYGEFIRGLDNKMRYFKPLRLKLYQKIVSKIRSIAPKVTVYFCMEDNDVWEQTMGFLPESLGGLPAILDNSAKTICELEDN